MRVGLVRAFDASLAPRTIKQCAELLLTVGVHVQDACLMAPSPSSALGFEKEATPFTRLNARVHGFARTRAALPAMLLHALCRDAKSEQVFCVNRRRKPTMILRHTGRAHCRVRLLQSCAVEGVREEASEGRGRVVGGRGVAELHWRRHRSPGYSRTTGV